MPSIYEDPSDGQKQQIYYLEHNKNTMFSRKNKIDPMRLMGSIFMGIGIGMIIIGVLIAVLLSFFLIGGFGFYIASLAGTWGTGIVFLLVALLLLVFFRDIQSAQIINQYLTALANQDYQTASAYIESTQNGSNSHATSIQEMQKQDEQGRITDYSLRGFRLNPQYALYTIKVQRGSRTYIMRFLLHKIGDT